MASISTPACLSALMTICFETDPRTPPSVFSTPAKRKGQAMVISPALTTAYPRIGLGEGTRS